MLDQLIVLKQWSKTRAELKEFLFKLKHLDYYNYKEFEEGIELLITCVDRKFNP